MVLSLHLARVLLLLVAACLAPSMAYAHPGHAHAAPAAHAPAVAEDVAAVPMETANEDVGQVPEFVVLRNEIMTAIPVTSDRQPSGCEGHCCGSLAGMACCSAALVPEVATAPIFSRAHPLLWLRADTLLGLAPEALPKPPKSFG